MAKHTLPEAVGDGFGEVGILRRDDPCGEGIPAVFRADPADFRAEEGLRFDGIAGFLTGKK